MLFGSANRTTEKINEEEEWISFGVIGKNSVECHIFDDAIDLNYEQYLIDKKKEKENNGEDDSNDDDDDDFYESDGSGLLIGDWVLNSEGKYQIDKNGKNRFAASTTETEIVVEWSNYYIYAQQCSPCFPNAGNLENIEPERGILTFALPLKYIPKYVDIDLHMNTKNNIKQIRKDVVDFTNDLEDIMYKFQLPNLKWQINELCKKYPDIELERTIVDNNKPRLNQTKFLEILKVFIEPVLVLQMNNCFTESFKDLVEKYSKDTIGLEHDSFCLGKEFSSEIIKDLNKLYNTHQIQRYIEMDKNISDVKTVINIYNFLTLKLELEKKIKDLVLEINKKVFFEEIQKYPNLRYFEILDRPNTFKLTL